MSEILGDKTHCWDRLRSKSRDGDRLGGDVKFLAPGDSPSRCTLARPQKTTTSAARFGPSALTRRCTARVRVFRPGPRKTPQVVLLKGLPGEDPQSPPPGKTLLTQSISL